MFQATVRISVPRLVARHCLADACIPCVVLSAIIEDVNYDREQGFYPTSIHLSFENKMQNGRQADGLVYPKKIVLPVSSCNLVTGSDSGVGTLPGSELVVNFYGEQKPYQEKVTRRYVMILKLAAINPRQRGAPN